MSGKKTGGIMHRTGRCVACVAIVVIVSAAANAANYVEVLTSRSNNPQNPTQAFAMEVEVVLDDVDPGDVDGVGVEVDNGLTSLTLQREDEVLSAFLPGGRCIAVW